MHSFAELDAKISAHDAWNNAFFEKCANGLALDDLRRVCPEYLGLTTAFPGILAHLVARADGGVQFHLVAILYSELGAGTEGRAHGRLFRTLCDELGVPLDPTAEPVHLPSTRSTIDGLRRVYRDAGFVESLGAQYALEYQADNMLRCFRRAFALFDRRKGNESDGMAFFRIHEQDEPQHSDAMEKALLRCIRSEDQFEEAHRGALTCLDLLASFWNGLDAAIAIKVGDPVEPHPEKVDARAAS